MGVTDLVSFGLWTLTSVDNELALSMTGQYHPDAGVEIQQQPTIAGNVTPGAAEPTVQWVAGGSRIVRFSSQFRSTHSLDDIRSQIDDLDRLRAQDPTLGRAPRVSLAWGDTEVTGFVANLRTTISGLWVTGLPKSVLFSLEITSAPDPTGEGVTGETQFLRLGQGETMETLGQRYLRSALRGDLIRRINPSIAGRPEQGGDLVRVFERAHPDMRGRVLPTGVPFVSVNEWPALVDELGALRGDADRGLVWSQLPEVQAGLVVVD